MLVFLLETVYPCCNSLLNLLDVKENIPTSVPGIKHLLFSSQFIILLRVMLVYYVAKFKFSLHLFKNFALKMCEGVKVYELW